MIAPSLPSVTACELNGMVNMLYMSIDDTILFSTSLIIFTTSSSLILVRLQNWVLL